MAGENAEGVGCHVAVGRRNAPMASYLLPFDKDGLAGFEQSAQFARTCQFGDQLHHAILSPTRDTSGPPDYEESL